MLLGELEGRYQKETDHAQRVMGELEECLKATAARIRDQRAEVARLAFAKGKPDCCERIVVIKNRAWVVRQLEASRPAEWIEVPLGVSLK